MPETVAIDKDDLHELVRDSLMLSALEAAGVDNWEFYSEAERPTDKEVEDLVEAYTINA